MKRPTPSPTPSPTDEARRTVNTRAAKILTAINHLPLDEAFAVLAQDGYHQIYIAVTPIRAQPPPVLLPFRGEIGRADDLPPLAAEIMAVLTDEPASPKQLASRAKRPLNRYFRETLKALERAGKAEQFGGGWRIKSA